MFSRVMTSSAMIWAYTSAASSWRRRNSPCTLMPRIRFGSAARRSATCRARWSTQPTTTPRIGSSHHWPNQWSTIGDRDAEQEAEDEPEGRPSGCSSRWPKSRKIADHQRRVLPEVVDHHDLRVEQLVDVLADLVGDVADDRRAAGPGPASTTRLRTARRQVAPQPRVLAAHDLVDHLGQLRLEDLRRCARRSGRARAAGRTPSASRAWRSPCRPRCCPSWRRGPGRCPASRRRPARRPGTSWTLRGSTRASCAHAGDRDAVEAHRGEQHHQAGPVDQPADDAGEDGDGEDVQPVDAVQPAGHAHLPLGLRKANDPTPYPSRDPSTVAAARMARCRPPLSTCCPDAPRSRS